MHEELDWFSGVRQLDSCRVIHKYLQFQIVSALAKN